MSYNTVPQFLTRAHPSGSFNHLATSVVQTFLDVGAAEIDASLRPHHTMPMNTGSLGSGLEVLQDAEAVIASYRLMMHVGFRPNIDGDVDSVLVNRYYEVTGLDGRPNALLTRISKGQYLFPDSADATSTVSEGAPIVVAASPGRSTQYSIHRWAGGRRVI